MKNLIIYFIMSNTVSNWNHWVESMPYTPQEFFQAIQERLQTMQIEEVKTELITHQLKS